MQIPHLLLSDNRNICTSVHVYTPIQGREEKLRGSGRDDDPPRNRLNSPSKSNTNEVAIKNQNYTSALTFSVPTKRALNSNVSSILVLEQVVPTGCCPQILTGPERCHAVQHIKPTDPVKYSRRDNHEPKLYTCAEILLQKTACHELAC